MSSDKEQTIRAQECVFYQLAKTNQAGNKVWRKAMSGFNVTAGQGMVLNFLYDGDGITSKDLGERTMLDSATLTGILDRLEKAGLIERQLHATDRRAITVCLTEEGRMLASQTYQEIERINHLFLNCLNIDEQLQFKALLTKIRAHSDQAMAEI